MDYKEFNKFKAKFSEWVDNNRSRFRFFSFKKPDFSADICKHPMFGMFLLSEYYSSPRKNKNFQKEWIKHYSTDTHPDTATNPNAFCFEALKYGLLIKAYYGREEWTKKGFSIHIQPINNYWDLGSYSGVGMGIYRKYVCVEDLFSSRYIQTFDTDIVDSKNNSDNIRFKDILPKIPVEFREGLCQLIDNAKQEKDYYGFFKVYTLLRNKDLKLDIKSLFGGEPEYFNVLLNGLMAPDRDHLFQVFSGDKNIKIDSLRLVFGDEPSYYELLEHALSSTSIKPIVNEVLPNLDFDIS